MVLQTRIPLKVIKLWKIKRLLHTKEQTLKQ